MVTPLILGKVQLHSSSKVDSGASSHMTPNRLWLGNYKPLRVPIRLADNTIVYSEGVGSIVFIPVINGANTRAIEFTRILHVPSLAANLFSVTFLTTQRKFEFPLDGTLLLNATVNEHNVGYLNGHTLLASEPIESAKLSATLPLDYTLWHCRLAHVNYDDVKKLVNQQLVTGIKLDSKIRGSQSLRFSANSRIDSPAVSGTDCWCRIGRFPENAVNR